MIALTAQEVKTSNWYGALIDELEAIRVETVYNAQATLIDGKYQMGKAICEQRHLGVTELVQYLAVDLKINERDLWYCAKFYQDYEKLKKLDAMQDKSISWNKIKKLITNPNPKLPCGHKHTETIVVCSDCGAKVKHQD